MEASMSRRVSEAVLLCCVFVFSVNAAGPTFRPDVVFKGSALAGWTPLGDAEWRAANGEIIGTPKQPGGGWLVLDKSFQDVAVFSNVTCTGGCKAGVLLRAEKTADGMKGIYVWLTPGDLLSYAVTLDARGRELGRTQLQPAALGGGGGRDGPGRSNAASRSSPGRRCSASPRCPDSRRPRTGRRASTRAAARRESTGARPSDRPVLSRQDQRRRRHAREHGGHRAVQRRIA